MPSTIRPRAGLIIRHPETRQPLPEVGIQVEVVSPYWLRRASDGDVHIEEVPTAAAVAPEEQA